MKWINALLFGFILMMLAAIVYAEPSCNVSFGLTAPRWPADAVVVRFYLNGEVVAESNQFIQGETIVTQLMGHTVLDGPNEMWAELCDANSCVSTQRNVFDPPPAVNQLVFGSSIGGCVEE